MSADKLEEIDIGDGDKPRLTFISTNLDPVFRGELIKLLKEYKDCFALDYSEMPGLDRYIVEHRLPIKSGFKPYKQPPRKIYKDEVLADVKKEIERLIEENFIRPCRYADWISDIVLVYKKNGKMRVCIDFRDITGLLLVEIGPEGWTPTQQPPFLSHSLLTTAMGTTATSAKKEDAETKQHKENTREHLADRRPKELRLPSVLSSHYSVSVSLQGVHYL
jgi:hypothetical protein